ncbi:hypothetical protein IKG60_00305 [Candidatus Saccharibacteria bacterium]|nr:hypothetical protein [Candidatus Saccharibacteria bacterium]
MENQADNSVAPKTNNTMSTADHKISQFSDSRITAAAIFAFLPNFGIIGVHNFILKQYKRSIAHIVIVIACYVPYFVAGVLCSHECYNVVVRMALLQYLAVASYIWAIVEGVQILQLKKQKVPSLPTASNSSIAQSSKPIVNAGDTSYFVADRPSPETVVKIEQEKKQDRKVWSILSIIATIIPIMLWSYCFMVSGGSTSENGPGAVWWLMIVYYWSLGVPLAVISIAFGIVGLKTSLRWLSVISLVLKAITAIAIIAIAIIPILLSSAH